MTDKSDEAKSKGGTAPYISFQTIKTVAKDMKEHGIPSRVDRSVFGNLSGSVISQLLPALKFLKLINDDGEPTKDLPRLVDASAEPELWAPVLEQVLRNAYAPLFALNLETASPSQFNERFRQLYPGTDDVSRKSQTFFLNAVRDAGIKVSPYVMKNKKPRGSGPAKKRAAKPNGAGKADAAKAHHAPPPPPGTHDKLPSEVLLGLFDPQMKDAEKDAVWTLIQYFKAKGK